MHATAVLEGGHSGAGVPDIYPVTFLANKMFFSTQQFAGPAFRQVQYFFSPVFYNHNRMSLPTILHQHSLSKHKFSNVQCIYCVMQSCWVLLVDYMLAPSRMPNKTPGFHRGISSSCKTRARSTRSRCTTSTKSIV